MQKSYKLLILICLVFCFNVACGLDEETQKANKLVEDGNALLKKHSEVAIKSNSLFLELFGEKITKVEDFDAYKEENKAKFDEIIKLNNEADKLGLETINKFDQATKLKLDEKFKSHLVFRVQEFRKRNEADKLVSPLVKYFLDSKDVEKFNTEIGEYNKKSDVLVKEADELSKKAEQVVKDNPTIFESK